MNLRAIHLSGGKMQDNKECLRLLYNAAVSDSLNVANAYTFMRSVGAEDMHGIEIYEGDIVQISEPKSMMHNQLLFIVIFIDCGFYPFIIKDWDSSINPENCEIIGNIHQNKDIAFNIHNNHIK
jgi:YopX protein